jgi:ATP-dependent helicase/nuclease subunit A
MARNDATDAQVRSARPDASTWLAANAGSGKTRVLTDRVARLLLDGEQPQHILCLTYTKAAASEMQNRLFQRLGKWAMLSDADLVQSLEDLGVEGPFGPERLADARTLFARAIETPGGLKIQTIHSFCASLLRRFPLEAGVSPQFTEIEDRAADLLRAEIVDQMSDGPDASLVAGLAEHYTGEDFIRLTKAMVQHRDAFLIERSQEDIWALFDIEPGTDEKMVEALAFSGGEEQLLAEIIPAMIETGGNDEKHAIRMQSIGTLDFNALPILEHLFLTGGNTKSPFSVKIGTFPTKKTQLKIPGHLEALNDLMRRVEAARSIRIAILAARKTLALHRFANVFLGLYETQKQVRGWLDFDDLILKARNLLTDSKVAAWVLFRIDGGIDHILVDEAQDTSPVQWDVIRKLADEFGSGEGARSDVRRTLFVVGDKKQSIYSFQGADPREFDRMKAEFREKLEAAGRLFQSQNLKHSFRSSAAILDVVDRIFVHQADAGFAETQHIAFKQTLPGRVDLWPMVETSDDEDDREWFDPLDRRGEQHHTVILAERIAHHIKMLVDSRHMIPMYREKDDQPLKRPVRYGDFLILVRRRSELFSEIIRACKTNGLPIAGADRLKVGGELAVRDLAALLSFLSTPEDSLSLATALRSPLFGWTEQDLYDLAHKRTQDHLWQALRARKDEFPECLSILNDLRNNTEFLRPYELVERILTRHGGRKNLIGRLGREAEDGINALLSQALAYERNAVPSLTGFLVWIETSDLEIKRQIDNASDQIRVMTVHGAKGLEAPIVILPDTGTQQSQNKDEIVKIEGVPVWKSGANEMPARMDATVKSMKSRQSEERLRLLYVALTRAEKWLIVAGAGQLSKTPDTWYQMVETALDACNAAEIRFQDLDIKRYAHGAWDDLPEAAVDESTAPKTSLESFFQQRFEAKISKKGPISPSDLGGPKALAGELGWDEEAAKAYGTLVHSYLERLSRIPPSDWAEILPRLSANGTPTQQEQAAAQEAQDVLSNSDLQNIFDGSGLSEVPIAARLGGSPLYGVVDRLIISSDVVTIVDFKTNRTVPETPQTCPEGLLRQMGAYAHALAQIYPDHRIETAILWTKTGHLMALPHETVSLALRNTPYLDADTTAT